jgi:small-conductance mechanosensitive channel
VEELGEGGGGLGGAAAHRRQVAALEKRAQQLQPQVASLARAKRDAEAHLAAKAEALAARAAANAAASARAAALEAQAAAAAGPAGELATLKGLVVLNEQLRSQEQSFKQNVKRQLGNLTAELAALEAKELADASSSDGNGGGGADDARLREIEAMHGKVTAKFARLRQLLAERNVAVSLASRLVDDVPLRAELLQYERRFNELYAQVAGKLAENKKYFAAYNTLDETHRMLAKEVTLINSIADHFDAAMASKATKEAFVAQLAGIIASTDAALGTQRAALAAKDATLEGLQAQHQALVDEQRAYFKAVKDFQAECTKNELYAAKLQEMTSG